MTEAREGRSDDNAKPGTSPALLGADDVRRNVAEWRAEVERRVSIAVTGALRKGRHPSEAYMHRLGAEGRRLYYQRLRNAVSAPVAAIQVAAGEPPITERRAHVAPRPSGSSLLILHELNWRGQQHRRPPYTWRAIEEGTVLTLILTAVGTLILHALPDHTVLSSLAKLLEVFQ